MSDVNGAEADAVMSKCSCISKLHRRAGISARRTIANHVHNPFCSRGGEKLLGWLDNNRSINEMGIAIYLYLQKT